MVDAAPFDTPPRRARIAPIAIWITLAFAIGLAAMWFAMRNEKWANAPAARASGTTAPATTQSAPAAVAAPATTDPLTLATRESALAAQLAALEARTATIGSDVGGAAQQAGRAEAILIAFAARRALDRGVPLGYLEEQLRLRFGASQPRATAIVIQASHDPVTVEALRQALDANAQLLMSSGGAGWLAGLEREIRSLIVLHDANAPSPLPADRLARARRMLDTGQVEPALAEVARLPGAAQAAKWTSAARRYIEARRALDALEAAAIVGAATPAPPATTQPAPAQPATQTQPQSAPVS